MCERSKTKTIKLPAPQIKQKKTTLNFLPNVRMISYSRVGMLGIGASENLFLCLFDPLLFIPPSDSLEFLHMWVQFLACSLQQPI